VSRVFSLNTDGVELVCLCYLASVTSAQIRYSVRRLRRKVPEAFILVILAGATNADILVVSSSSDRVEFVQHSLGETVATVLAIASSSSKLGELSAATSPQGSVATNPRSQSELRAV
jgi:hypothetical protein